LTVFKNHSTLSLSLSVTMQMNGKTSTGSTERSNSVPISSNNDNADDDDLDDLDELLGLIDEDEEGEEQQQQIQTKKKADFESEIYVLPSKHCKIKVDPKTRAISTDSLALRLRRWTFVSMMNLPLKLNDQCVTKKEFVVIGILSHKFVKQSKNGNKYLLLKLDDFKASISVFVFDAAIIENFFKIQPGTVIVLAAPTVLSEQNNNSSNKAKFQGKKDISLKVDEPEQVLVVGRSLDFAICPKINSGTGERCDGVIDKSRYDLCEFHRAKQYKKFASKRNDTNRTKMSRLRNPQSARKSLSGKMNGLSMVQRRAPKNFYAEEKKKVKPKNVDHALNRCKNRDLLYNSSAMRKTSVLGKRLAKYTKGGKNQMQIATAAKRKEMGAMMKGKTLMPHLGANWGASSSSGKGSGKGGGLILMGGPGKGKNEHEVRVSTQKSRTEKRKRSYDAFMSASNEKENASEMSAEVGMGGGSPMKKKAKVKVGEFGNVLRAKSENLAVGKECLRVAKAVAEEDTWEALEVFVCKFGTCGLRDKVTESMNSFCEGHSMNVVRSRGKKYFWECTHCGMTTTTLNTKKHRKNCKCGKKEYYVPTSAEGAANPTIKNNEKSFHLG